MAYVALVSLTQTIDLILNYHQHSMSPQIKDQIISIHEYAIFLQAFLEDFPDEARRLEVKIRMVTNVAEDIIEFSMSEQIRESSCVLLESTVGPSKTEFKVQAMGEYEHWELKLVTREFESIAKEVMEIKNSSTVKDVQLGDSTATSSSSPVQKDAMVGCDDDLMEIKSRLCGESSNLEVIPIIGMGGIGKTTLARNAYDDPLVVEYFQIRAWVTVSQDYSVQEIVSSLLLSMKVFDAKNEQMEAHRVYQNLMGRRYLIVLDDMWSIKAWDDLKKMFPDDGYGSRIMLTTRLSDVGCYPDSYSPVHEMRLMDEDQSWNLLRKMVFKQGPCPVELQHVGKKIARSCQGLPLAIAVISGLLTVDQTRAAWDSIAEDVKSAISANDEQFDKILSLSYTHLPHHLIPCFLFMGGFPEDYEMRVSKLIKLWVAEGFLKPNGCNKSSEETAEEYLEDLVKRNLVLATKRKSNGGIKSCSMHDLMREMCRRKAQEEDFFLHMREICRRKAQEEDFWEICRRKAQEEDFGQWTKIRRRVSIIHSDLDFLESFYSSTIRTILCFGLGQGGTRCSLGYFRLLKILEMVYSRESFYNPILSLPDEVFELFHLRYLAFNLPLRIPAAVSNLRNLQSLVIGPRNYPSTHNFVKLPVEIWGLPQLRHLKLFCYLSLIQEASVALENLQTLLVARNFKNLQTLSGVINFICTPKILKMIQNLKKLGICYAAGHEEKYGKDDYQLHNLVYMQHLENMKLVMYPDFPFPEKVKPVFPRTLKKLTLSGVGVLSWKDMTVVGSLSNLEVLKLRNYACIGDTWETIEGEFSELKFLLIDESDLQHWITESSHFPKLKFLVLHYFSRLRELPDGIGEIPTLELIEVSDWDLVKSAKQIQEEQLSYGNNVLQVRAFH